ncbi:MAG TPA: lipid-A-disaccharide synthase N-terminal domain-containing protein [Candidatus Polarisedimenticolia bacterium]|nr:lipid-A-disaccharide synthase N-terminal domain-containing protein [Candidatus Polarisedimenticolia bacterium]
MNLDRLLHLNAWVFFGLLGQVFFTLRFLVQWLVSERSGRSTLPVAFWYLSLLGGGMLFVYALWYCHDLVFTLGQSAGLLVYTRNLMLIRRQRGREEGRATQGVPGPGA